MSHVKTEKIALKQKLSIAIQKNSKILLGLLALIVLVVLGLLIFNSIQLKSLEKYTQEIEAIQDEYAQLELITDEDKKTESTNEVFKKLDLLIINSPKNYALQRALFIRANLNYQSKEWDKAIEDFKNVALDFPNSYLAPISLINAASAYEEFAKIDDAIETYRLVINGYAKISPEIPNIYFSIGRLCEQKNDTEAALEEYNTLVYTFPDSNWTNLARSRIIYLESR